MFILLFDNFLNLWALFRIIKIWLVNCKSVKKCQHYITYINQLNWKKKWEKRKQNNAISVMQCDFNGPLVTHMIAFDKQK